MVKVQKYADMQERVVLLRRNGKWKGLARKRILLNGPDFKAGWHLVGLRAKDLGQHRRTKIVQQKFWQKAREFTY